MASDSPSREQLTQWIRPDILTLSAYQVPDSLGMVKMDAMENPHTLPLAWSQLLAEKMAQIDINRYPDASASALKFQILKQFPLPAGQQVVLGNGSDELIQMLQLVFGGQGRTVLAPVPSFVMYEMIARFSGTKFIGIPLGNNFSLDTEAMLAAITQHQPALVFIAHPNNPSGNCFEVSAIEQIITATSGLVVIDEAYFAFAEHSFLPLLGRWNNLLVMRTVSKLGLAGLRLGWLSGAKTWVEQIEKVRLPYNINSLSQAAVVLALEHIDLLRQQAREICRQREYLLAQLGAIPGVTCFPSSANFILLRVKDACRVFEHLKARNILIKNLHQTGSILENCLRVTVGTYSENEQLLQVLRSAPGLESRESTQAQQL
ncbi:MAG TPA: histidinol-phosphate transaminase [Gammaproteobacteria bacterium]|nr:histidinol-phosphate transaminase [Gammaproteobacteria bacterium]